MTSNERRKQAESALRIYLDRGAKALASLQSGDLEQANKWLEKRDIAYRNFAALDHASRRGDDHQKLTESDEYRQLIDAVHLQNMRLKLGLRDSIKRGEDELRRNRTQSRTIGRFQTQLRRAAFKTGA
jgi:hypothetical protein